MRLSIFHHYHYHSTCMCIAEIKVMPDKDIVQTSWRHSFVLGQTSSHYMVEYKHSRQSDWRMEELKHLSNHKNWKIVKTLWQFLVKCQKVIGFTLCMMLHTLKNACHFFFQSGVKQTPIVIGLHMLTCITCSYRYLPRVLIGSLVVIG